MNSDKFKTFEHAIDSYIDIALHSNLEYSSKYNKYVITSYPSVIFNFLYLKQQDNLIKKTIDENIPFMCFPAFDADKQFHHNATNYGLTFSENVVAHEFDNLNLFNYIPNDQILIAKISTNEELTMFDEISSECFMHQKGLAADFFKAGFYKK